MDFVFTVTHVQRTGVLNIISQYVYCMYLLEPTAGYMQKFVFNGNRSTAKVKMLNYAHINVFVFTVTAGYLQMVYTFVFIAGAGVEKQTRLFYRCSKEAVFHMTSLCLKKKL